ncbi:MAG: hypothetical protein WBN88_15375 [Anderseniella sp.]
MNKSSMNPTVVAPTREEMEFYIRKGKQLQSEAVHTMLKSGFHVVIKSFSAFNMKRKQLGGKTVAPISGHHVHGN